MIYYDIIGYISIIFSILAFLAKDKESMRRNGLISAFLFGISIYGYNGYNGLFVSSISVFVKLLSLKYDEDKLFSLKVIAIPLAVIFYFMFNTEGMYGLLPAISLVFIILADIQKDLIKMKIIYYGSAFAWLLYAISINSLPAIIYDVVGIIALTYSIVKIRREIN